MLWSPEGAHFGRGAEHVAQGAHHILHASHALKQQQYMSSISLTYCKKLSLQDVTVHQSFREHL